MKFIGDFHIHSHYSRATSKKLIPEYLEYWAKLKGIKVIGTGDFTHPGWTKELKEKLIPAEQGLFKLKDKYKLKTDINSDNEVRFLLTSEISNIYKKFDKVRKVHNCVFAPDFETVDKIQQKLSGLKFNITSDGRPILGLDSRDLLEIMLEANAQNYFVPAHIWTPWFSALGSKSGFDSIKECYGDMAKYISAVETGLSTNAPMNWMCKFLDDYTLISNSDAHSPEKLGRNANIFNTELSYDAIINAMRSGNPELFLGTIDLFPQEGKYFYDGHRKCNISWNPVETLKHNEICSVCGRKVTVGVLNRILQLSDREDVMKRKNRLPFHPIIPLKEILSEITGVGPSSKKVTGVYDSILKKLGPELNILLNIPVDEINKKGGEILSEAIKRMRNQQVYIKEGFDGEYGQIKVFEKNEQKNFSKQKCLFDDIADKTHNESGSRLTAQVTESGSRLTAQITEKQDISTFKFSIKEYKELKQQQKSNQTELKQKELFSTKILTNPFEELNTEQLKATQHFSGPLIIIAGPGTGKTKTLTCSIANLIKNKNVKPENILALTFTNKAANEMKERLLILLNAQTIVNKMQISTFHGFGFSILKRYYEKTGRNKHFSIIDNDDEKIILNKNIGITKKNLKKTINAITKAKQNLKTSEQLEDKEQAKIFYAYETILQEQNLFDIDDMIYEPVRLWLAYPEILAYYREKYKWVFVDEYQDTNFAQYQMIRLLKPDNDSNLCVTGDPNQAIYGFQGADIQFIKKFTSDYPDATQYYLKKSYRCSDNILKASENIVKDKTAQNIQMLEGLHKGVKIKIIQNRTEKSEAEFVARTIENMLGGLGFFSIDSNITQGNENTEIKGLSDFVILCRIKNQMKSIEKALNDHSIPFQTIENIPFFKQKPLSHIIDLLKLSINTENTFLKEKLVENKIITHLEFTKFIDALNKQPSVKHKSLYIIDNYFANEKSENEALFKNFISITDDYKDDLDKFLRFTALGTGIDVYKPNTEKVTLMTLHSAKGLEFKCVFIVGCENGLIPYSIFETQKADINEEKRLLYVGMTRA